MSQNEKPQGGSSRNEGEGNRTAARQYDEAQRRFVKSGAVEEKAREAEKALQTGEKHELDRAEAIGKRHSHGEDPEVTRKR
jgi:hypothetical protein